MKENASIIALAVVILAVVLHVGVISPMSQSLLKMRSELSEEELRLTAIEMGNAQREEVKARIAALEKENAKRRATYLMPLLNSYAMSVKALVDVMAMECGLINVEYNEGELLTLPVPKECLPDNRTARRSIRINALADYAAAVSFLWRVETELPLTAVQSFTVRQTKDLRTDKQDVEIILEWPGKGEVIK